MDLALAVILFVIFFPVMVVVALVIKLDSKGPIFADTPERIGKGGSLLKCINFDQ